MHDNSDRESVFHERINLLKSEGYRGFTVTGGRGKWDGVEIVAINSDGLKLNAEGDTQEEAYERIIDLIDHTLDDAI